MLPLDETGLEQDFEVMAHRRLGQAERLGQVADARFGRGLCLDQAEQAKPRRISEDLQRRREPLRLVGIDRLLEQRRARGRDRGDLLHSFDIDSDL